MSARGAASALAALVGWTPVLATAQASLELPHPGTGARVFVHGEGDHVRLTWRGDGAPTDHECTSPCTLHVESGPWHARYEELALEADFELDGDFVVLEPSPRSELELGVGLAFVGAALAVAAITVGVDEGRCISGRGCEGWVPGLLIPSAVVLVVGIVMTLDAGGELHVTRVSPD